MNKKIRMITTVVIELLVLISYSVISIAKVPVSYTFAPEAFVFDAGVRGAQGVFVSEMEEEALVGISTNPVTLPRGTYKVSFTYDVSDENSTYDFLRNGYPYYALEYDTGIYLNSHENTQEAFLNVTTETEGFQARVLYHNKGTILLKNVEILQTKTAELLYGIKLALFFILVDIILFVIFRKKESDCGTQETSSMFLPVLLVGLIASIPLMADYLIEGHDLNFHLLRIEGIKEALLSGQFPVRIHPTQFNGYGYPAGIYYPELFLHIPAWLRIVGFSVMDAYKIFIFLQNMLTAYVSYHSFKKMFNSRRIGLVGCVLYTLSLYRLINVYYRSAVGESLAMTFLPVIFMGAYLILNSEKQERIKRRQGIFALTLGLSGVVQSHILSCEMLGIMCGLLCLLYIKQIFSEKRWLDLGISGVLTLLLNLWFLLPFVQYMTHDIIIKQWKIRDIMVNTLNPVQIFFPTPNVEGMNEILPNGIYAEMPFGIGFAITLGLICIVLGFKKWYKIEKERKQFFGIVCLFMGGICLWMTTYVFPWTRVDEIGGLVSRVMNMVQFPWRYLGLATVFFIIAILFFANSFREKQYRKTIHIMLMLVSIFTCCMFSQELYQNESVYRVYSKEGLEHVKFESTEYLYRGTKIENIVDANVLIDRQSGIISFGKNGSNINVSVKNNTNQTIDCLLPVFYFPCYIAYDVDTNEVFKIESEPSANNVLKIVIPPQYSGDIRVEVKDDVLWQVANIISIITWLSLLVSIVHIKMTQSERKIYPCNTK